MLSVRGRRPTEVLIEPIARGLLKARVSPNVVTVVGAAGATLVAVLLIPAGYLTLAAILAGLTTLWYAAEMGLAHRAKWYRRPQLLLAFLIRDTLIPALWTCAWMRGAILWRGNAMDIRPKAGGFDPAFAFHLDESDLNLRLAALFPRSASALVPLAEVIHGAAPGTVRAPGGLPRDLAPIGRSAAIFARRHGGDFVNQTDFDGAGADGARQIRDFGVSRGAISRVEFAQHVVDGCFPVVFEFHETQNIGVQPL